jgi:peptidoglycan/LPS O-acetylase OafA/YrhL
MRPEIQALRAVAVTLVLVYHLWPGRVPGGYVGVDVFFVISGFLITSHLLREVVRDRTVSVTQFWARRIRRLLPAAYTVLLASFVAVLLWIPRSSWEQAYAEIAASAGYAVNWLLAFNSVDYLGGG